MKKSEILRSHFDEIVDAMTALDTKRYPYQIDLYVYPDGHTYEYTNIGDSSWLDDDHIKVWSVSHEDDDDTGLLSMTDDEYLAECRERRNFYEDILNKIIENMERDNGKLTLPEVLKKIKCTTLIGKEDVTEFVTDREDFPNGTYEIYFRIYSLQGDVIGTIYKHGDSEMSKLDYVHDLDFDRNVNLTEVTA